MATQGSNHLTAATVILLLFFLKLVLQIDGWQRLVFPDPLIEHKGFCLQGLVFHMFKTSDIQVCGMCCLKQSKCKSFNYDKGGKRCELNKEDQDVRSSPCFRQIEGCSYFSRKELEVMEMFLGKCSRHSCPDDTVCVPDGAWSSKRYNCEPSDTDGNQTNHTLQVPVTWPIGMYGLMMTSNGCPGDLWLSGWRRFDTEDINPGNYFTDGIKNYLKGYFEIDDIETHFCIKNIPSFTSYDTSWPKGSYCILMYGGSCPSGFQSGFIQWNNEDNGNKNARGGTLPDGVYDSDTRIYFCCRNDGLTSTPISLPTDQPFILVRISTTCQTVYGMGVTEVFVQWDEDDVDDASDPGGLHPYDDDSFYNLRLYFCYYYG